MSSKSRSKQKRANASKRKRNNAFSFKGGPAAVLEKVKAREQVQKLQQSRIGAKLVGDEIRVVLGAHYFALTPAAAADLARLILEEVQKRLVLHGQAQVEIVGAIANTTADVPVNGVSNEGTI